MIDAMAAPLVADPIMVRRVIPAMVSVTAHEGLRCRIVGPYRHPRLNQS